MSKLRTVIKVATDPRWWPFYAQRRILSPDARNAIAGLVARRRPQARITAPQLAEAGAANLDGHRDVPVHRRADLEGHHGGPAAP